MPTITEQLKSIGKASRVAAKELAKLTTSVKNQALANLAEDLERKSADIISANKDDISLATTNGINEDIIDRLLINEERLKIIAAGVHNVANLPDPIGETFDKRNLPNGLEVGRVRVPIGIIGSIYESRPNVTVDISALCLKSGNSVILRGGSEAINSTTALAKLIRESISIAGVPQDAVQLVEPTDRTTVTEMLKMKEFIDLMIPRGGADLIKFVSKTAQMPSITGGVGVCHLYVDNLADHKKAVEIVHNSKVQRPSVCNALDTLLVHSDIADIYLPSIAKKLGASVEIRCDKKALDILSKDSQLKLKAVTAQDWDTEHLSLIISVKIVDSLEEALIHIDKHGSGHTEAIVTENNSIAQKFVNDIDASMVLVNASTRFNDGGQIGLGAEVAISTDKLHARGPMGLKELTSYKWTVFGNGQVRN